MHTKVCCAETQWFAFVQLMLFTCRTVENIFILKLGTVSLLQMSQSISDFPWFSCDKTRVVMLQHYTQTSVICFLTFFLLINYFSSSDT